MAHQGQAASQQHLHCHGREDLDTHCAACASEGWAASLDSDCSYGFEHSLRRAITAACFAARPPSDQSKQSKATRNWPADGVLSLAASCRQGSCPAITTEHIDIGRTRCVCVQDRNARTSQALQSLGFEHLAHHAHGSALKYERPHVRQEAAYKVQPDGVAAHGKSHAASPTGYDGTGDQHPIRHLHQQTSRQLGLPAKGCSCMNFPKGKKLTEIPEPFQVSR